ncbi:Hypothetical protein FKW44_013424 [Caligus rogercresseyi]|uniref:Uncharacterized protein n=1 Tax=Caligus rogercresseyi TaxID=217165 RepID=A0A7T8HKV3_CALRO|nr:Hypothetical protein FKW44_013424 [Caligus rogercresseyi]
MAREDRMNDFSMRQLVEEDLSISSYHLQKRKLLVDNLGSSPPPHEVSQARPGAVYKREAF